MTRIATLEAPVVLDYPSEKEVITSPNYTLRFGASGETQTVEVSIDGGSWQQCRQAGGYFWFDWANCLTGRHEIAARAKPFNGQIEELPARSVRVELERNPQ